MNGDSKPKPFVLRQSNVMLVEQNTQIESCLASLETNYSIYLSVYFNLDVDVRRFDAFTLQWKTSKS